MTKNCCVQFCVGLLVFIELVGGLLFLLGYLLQARQPNEYRSQDDTILFDFLLIVTLSVILSGLLLLMGVIWRQPKHVLAHLIIDFIITIGSIILIFVHFIYSYYYGLDLEINVSICAILIIPFLIICGLDYGIYFFYKEMTDNYRETQNINIHELDVFNQ